MRGDTGGAVTPVRCDIRDGGAVDAMMDVLWHDAPIDVLVNNAAATFIAQTEHLSFRAADAILGPTLHGTMYCTLASGKRWIGAQHKGVVLSLHPFDLDHHGTRLHGAVGDGEVRHSGDDQELSCGVGAEGHPHRRDRAGRVSDGGRIGPASP